ARPELATMRRRCDSIEHPPMPAFPKPPRAEPAFAFEASRPPGPWLESTRPAELRSSSFGATLFDAAAGTAPAASAPAVFDVCHVGVVLRAVLVVNGIVAVGVMFAAHDVAGWLSLATLGCAVALPGVSFWLSAACLLKP